MNSRPALVALMVFALVMFVVCMGVAAICEKTSVAIGYYLLAIINFHTFQTASSTLGSTSA